MADGNFNNNQRRERPKYALNDFRFRLNGKRLEGAARPCGIGFEVSREGIKITAFTNVEGDDENGMIKAELSLQDAFFVVTLLERAPRMHPGTHDDIPIAGSQFNRNTNKRETKHQATLRIGRNDQGVIYMRMESWKSTRPKVLIEMLPSNFLRLVDAQGNQAPADKVSELTAVSWAKSLSIMLPLALTTEYARVNAPKDGNQQGGGNRGGGNYNRGGNQSGGQQSQGGGHASSGGNSYGGGNNYDFGGDDLPM